MLKRVIGDIALGCLILFMLCCIVAQQARIRQLETDMLRVKGVIELQVQDILSNAAW